MIPAVAGSQLVAERGAGRDRILRIIKTRAQRAYEVSTGFIGPGTINKEK